MSNNDLPNELPNELSNDLPNDLKGVRVLVTRPVGQAAQLVQRIREKAGTAVLLPMLEIQPVENSTSAALLANLQEYDLVIFVSANAVHFAQHRILNNQVQNTTVGAIGRGTARALAAVKITPQLLPQQSFDSEGFLALAEVQQMSGQRVLIVRGEHGREKLASVLKARGAEVDYAEVYRRVMPELEISQHVMAGDVDVVTVTSGEALSNLATLASQQKQHWVFDKPLIVIHDRLAEYAKELGFNTPVWVTREVSDESIVDKLVEWKKGQGAINE